MTPEPLSFRNSAMEVSMRFEASLGDGGLRLPRARRVRLDDDSSGDATVRASAPAVELTVFAASSLTAAFTQIGSDFEAANAGHHRDVQLRIVGRPRGIDRVRGHRRRVRVGERDLHGRGERQGRASPAAPTSRRTSSSSSRRPTTRRTSRASRIWPSRASRSCSRPKACRWATTRARRSRTRGSPTRSSRTSSPTRRTTRRSSRRSRRARPTPRSSTCRTSRARSLRTSTRWRSPTTST